MKKALKLWRSHKDLASKHFCAVHKNALDTSAMRYNLALHAAVQYEFGSRPAGQRHQAARSREQLNFGDSMMTSAAKKAVTDKISKQAEAAVNASKEGVEAAMKAGTDALAKTYEQVAAATREQMDVAFKACEKTFKDVDGYKDIADFNKGNVDAAFQAGAAMVKGVQEFGKTWTGMAQASLESSLAATQATFACRNFKDFAEVQADLAKKAYNEMLSDSRTLATLSAKVAEETFAPVRARVDATVAVFSKSPSA
jgi:phasin family protein